MTYEFPTFYVNSYPRSGNTWVRKMLVDLLNPRLLDANPIFAKRFRFLDRARFEHADYAAMGASGGYMIKSHLTHSHCRGGLPILYLVRDGRDSLFSYYNYSLKHRGYTETWPSFFERYVVSRDMRTFRERYLAEHMGDWSENCLSYLNKPNVLVVRYEDLLRDTAESLRSILDWLGCRPHVRDEALRAVIDRHELDIERKRQRDHRPRGSAGVWQRTFTVDQTREFEARHKTVLSMLGYEVQSKARTAGSVGY